jgi:hypothetical protein
MAFLLFCGIHNQKVRPKKAFYLFEKELPTCGAVFPPGGENLPYSRKKLNA